jgi:hypothetical protein
LTLLITVTVNRCSREFVSVAVWALGKLTGNPSDRVKNKVAMMKKVRMAKITSIIGTMLIWGGMSRSSSRIAMSQFSE